MSPNHPCSLLVTAASDSSTSCERVLRAALVVAKGMGDEDFSRWCGEELSGYFNTPRDALPDYRWTQGIVMVKDAWGQTYPAMFKSAADQERIARSHIAEPIGQVEKNAESPRGSDFYVSFPPELGARLREALGGAVDVFRVIQKLAFENVVTHVRQKVFMWAVENNARTVPLDLPTTTARMLGITHAQPSRTAHVPALFEALPGSINMSHSNLILNSGGASASVIHHEGVDREALVLLAAELRKMVTALDSDRLPPDLVTAAEELDALAGMSKPRASFVGEALKTLRTVLEGGAGALLGEVSKPYLLMLMANVLKG